MKKRISAALAATVLLTGCSWGDFWKVSREEKGNSEPVEEITTEPPTELISAAEVQSGERNINPVVDRHTRYIDLTRQKNREYWKRDSHESRYRMKGCGSLIEDSGNIRLRDTEGEEKILVSAQGIGGMAEIDCKIDESRFVFTVYNGDTAIKSAVYDLETESYIDISDGFDVLPYSYHRPYISGNNIVMRMKAENSGDDYSYLLVDSDTYKIRKAGDGIIPCGSDYSWAAFSPDGNNMAVISGGAENNGQYEYTVTLYSPDTDEKLEEFVIGTTVLYSEFSLKFVDNSMIYVYAAGGDVTGWSDLYMIDLWYGDGIEYIQNTKNKQGEYPDAENVVIAAPDETDTMNIMNPLVLSDDEGYYYYGYYYDSGDGKLSAFCAGSVCSWNFVGDGVLYGTTYQSNGSASDVVAYACKYENNEISIISEASDVYKECVYTPDYIYYMLEHGDSKGVYRMDYSGKNHKRVLAFEDSESNFDFIVNGSKIYYKWSDYTQLYTFGVYDMETKEHKRLNDGELGRINGGYMYYKVFDHYEDNSGFIYNLMRMNLEDYTIEKVCEDVWDFDFQGNSIIYDRNSDKDQGIIYRLENGESKAAFSCDTLGEDCYIYGFQCTEDEIILKAETDVYNICIIGIDASGNIKKYHEYGEWNAPPAY